MLLLIVAAPLAAQRRLALRFVEGRAAPVAAPVTPTAVSDSLHEPDAGRMLAGGLIGGVLGAGVGAAVGALAGTGRICGDDRCSLIYGVYGFGAGEALGVPLGVHLAGGRRGLYPVEFFASALAGGAVAVAFVRAGATPVAVVAAPAVQLLTAGLLEVHLRF